MSTLDSTRFEFSGHQLVEASAGTGKTHALTNLYLKRVLQGAPVEQILVVTFTNAATDELRGRIRRRLQQAHLAVRDERWSDPDLAAMLAHLALTPESAEQRLRGAVVAMDEAAIYTIHGFCQRALGEFAFYSGMQYEVEFVTDEQQLLLETVHDYWRTQFYPLTTAAMSAVTQKWTTPDQLLAAIRPYLSRQLLIDTGSEDIDDGDLEAAVGNLNDCRSQLIEAWFDQGETVHEWLLRHRDALNRQTYSDKWFDRLPTTWQAFVDSNAAGCEIDQRLTLSTLSQRCKKGRTLPAHPFFALAQTLADQQQDLQLLADRFQRQQLRDAIEKVRDSYTLRKRQRGVVTADDLLTLLFEALSGDRGKLLSDRLRQRYPLALVDEFQDTDPLQYQIFNLIYAHSSASALTMIGDPKQAIYGFRGADIFTYIHARRHIPARHRYTLDTNWRSTATLVHAVNTLFQRRDAAFIYERDIPFIPAHTPEQNSQMPGQSGEPGALEFWLLERPEDDKSQSKALAKQVAYERAARAVASHISALLRPGGRQADQDHGPVPARDVAVLVGTHHQARLVRDALRAVGLGSAYIGSEDVFQSTEARDLDQLLTAVADPGNRSALRSAMAVPLLNETSLSLYQSFHQDGFWNPIMQTFADLHQIWLTQGFMGMFQNLLQHLEIPQRLVRQPDGERALTNLLQLGELLQSVSLQHHSMDDLLSWYRERLLLGDTGDAAKLRLESDESLVQIVTLHRSKGLQYPVVYLPFLWHCKPVGDGECLYHDDSDALVLDLAGSGQVRADRERLAEDVRLLYVALTRAQRRNFVVWGHIGHKGGASHSALAWLLHSRADPQQLEQEPLNAMLGMRDADVRSDLEDVARVSDGAIAVRSLPEPEQARQAIIAETPAGLQAQAFEGAIDTLWRVSSYTGLTRGVHNPVDHDNVSSDLEPEIAAQGVFAFPRGAHAGNFLHAVLEQIEPGAFEPTTLEPHLDRLMPRYGIGENWRQELLAWLQRILRTPLDDSGLRLDAIARGHCRAEMGFWFSCAAFQRRHIEQLLRKYRDAEVPQLAFSSMEGMLTGQIDLVFEHDGRYYLADYKSNHLGNRASDYRYPQLLSAMHHHLYDLQYLIYTLALHRYLATRLPGYQYKRHFGGVFYLFLRGMDGSGNTGVYRCRPDLEIVAELDAVFGAGARNAH